MRKCSYGGKSANNDEAHLLFGRLPSPSGPYPPRFSCCVQRLLCRPRFSQRRQERFRGSVDGVERECACALYRSILSSNSVMYFVVLYCITKRVYTTIYLTISYLVTRVCLVCRSVYLQFLMCDEQHFTILSRELLYDYTLYIHMYVYKRCTLLVLPPSAPVS